MFTDPDPQFLAPARSLGIGQGCPVFRRADLATLVSREKMQ